MATVKTHQFSPKKRFPFNFRQNIGTYYVLQISVIPSLILVTVLSLWFSQKDEVHLHFRKWWWKKLQKLARKWILYPTSIQGYVRSLHGPTNRFNSNFCAIVQFIKFDQSICTPSISSSMKCIHPFPICHSCITLFLSYVSHISIKYSIVHIPSFPVNVLWNLVNSHSELRLSVNY